MNRYFRRTSVMLFYKLPVSSHLRYGRSVNKRPFYCKILVFVTYNTVVHYTTYAMCKINVNRNVKRFVSSNKIITLIVYL